ncbi:TonB-linked outer membrane protein, SusC/RagA family [Galbibacter orientalis DSM 19592]|uniref:TonB-linked outer membrane protein, SusC/RagA family n=1 Tax=Galbibacter orientalis DSM 19592 TaxID=926559 RepID=I3CAL2_9FLAO|nr:TonB-dependent receptor [Galbibacter orientalis]EIJ40655.1 TonB-linked outer membrane protein, SusC/RagA family [Galbibacter orientalis DSM 19592]
MKNKILLFSLLVLSIMYGVKAGNNNQNTFNKIEISEKINLNLKNSSIERVFELIEAQSKRRFIYRSDQHFLKENISININNANIKETLTELEKLTSLEFKIAGDGILVKEIVNTNSTQQQRKISGTIRDNSGTPVPGANVFVAGTNIGTPTDFDGNFVLNVPIDTETISVTFMGFKRADIDIVGKTEISISLEEDTNMLEQIVVVGYGTEKRENITAAISTVDPEEIKSLPKANVAEMLQGRMPGVQVMSDNRPGGGTSIRVRGFSTINNNDPLVVIDGVPTSNGLSSINPQDIESIQVLKDAASSSIYGSRAANGVVVITTKKGARKDSFVVNFDGYAGLQTAINLPRMLNAQQYGDLLWQAYKNDGQTPAHDIYGNNPNQAQIPEWLNTEQTLPSSDVDWVAEIMQPAFIQNYNVSIQKGSEKGQHSFSLGYYDQEGVVKHTGFSRYSARFNSNYKVTDWLTIGENFTGSYTEEVSVGTNSSLGSIIYDSFQFPSIVPVKDLNGEFGGNPINDVGNPLGNLYRAKDNKRKNVRAFGNAFAALNFGDFTFKSSFGLDYNNFNYRGFSPVYDEILSQNTINSLSTQNSYNYQFTFTNTLNYAKSFGNHNLDVLLGQEAIEYYNENFSASRQNFLYEDLNFRYLSFGTENQLNAGNAGEWKLNSYFGRVNYNFDEKYLLTATVRRDGTSRLANNNWGTFPAFSAGWRVDKENFFDFGNGFTNMMIRASWGQTGNQQVPSYSTVDSYSNNNNYSDYAIDGGQNSVSTGLAQTRVPNADLQWETTTQTSLGVDLGFFNNKLSITAEVYKKVTDDILVYNAVPLTFGGTNDGQWINDGSMENKGYELNFKFRDQKGDFGYDLGLNVTGYKNELKELYSVAYLGIPSSSLHSVNFDQEISRSTVGEPIASFFGYQAAGLFRSQQEVDAYGLQPDAQPGDIKFEDVNNDGVIDDKDRTFIGSPHPDVVIGFNVNLNYKNFDLGMFFNASIGNDLYNLTKYKTQFFNQSAYNKDSSLLGAWTPANPDADIPRLSLDDPNNNIRPSSYYVEDGSYLKLNNLQVGYTIPASVLGDLNLRVYAQASNVFTITDYSGMTPEIGLQNYSSSSRNLDIGVDRGIYPPSRTFVFGFNLKF